VPRRHGNLYEHICSFDNLLLAARKARKGKRHKGEVARFEFDREPELLRIQRELREQTYVPAGYRQFWVQDTKRRLISAAPYRDRVVHHALCNVIEPIFDRSFIFDSYANRQGKGSHQAVDRYQQFCRKNHYVLKCDVTQYFASMDHEILMQQIERKIKCPRTQWLLRRIIENSGRQEEVMHYFPGDGLFTPLERLRGIPVGNLTSQLCANIYLDSFDHWIKEEMNCSYYVRYVDDFLILSDDKSWLREIRAAVIERLAMLRLKLHENKCQVRRVKDGTEFLGFRVFPGHRRLRRSNVVHCRRRLRRLQREYAAGHADVANLTQSVRSWIAHAQHGNTYRLREQLFAQTCFTRATP